MRTATSDRSNMSKMVMKGVSGESAVGDTGKYRVRYPGLDAAMRKSEKFSRGKESSNSPDLSLIAVAAVVKAAE